MSWSFETFFFFSPKPCLLTASLEMYLKRLHLKKKKNLCHLGSNTNFKKEKLKTDPALSCACLNYATHALTPSFHCFQVWSWSSIRRGSPHMYHLHGTPVTIQAPAGGVTRDRSLDYSGLDLVSTESNKAFAVHSRGWTVSWTYHMRTTISS